MWERKVAGESATKWEEERGRGWEGGCIILIKYHI